MRSEIDDYSFTFNSTPRIVVKDKTKVSVKAVALLHYGQFFDTDSMCHSTRLIPSTFPTLNDQNGVSVENVPVQSKQSFALRILYYRILKAKKALEARNMECYIPMRYKQFKKQSKTKGYKVIVTAGKFKGILGRVVHLAELQHAIVESFGRCLAATAYMPIEVMEKFEH